jgi:hypothetical protein
VHRTLEAAVNSGFVCLEAFDRDPYFASIRARPWWKPLRERVQAEHDAACAAFADAGGPDVLGLTF